MDPSKFLFKKIYISNFQDICIELRSHVLNNLPANKNNFNHLDSIKLLKDCPLMSTWMIENSLILRKIAIITVNAKSTGSIHTDTQQNFLALNFPILNCEDTYTGLYRVTQGEPKIVTMTNGLTYSTFDNCEFEEITRYNITDSAVLFNTKIPHRVNNPTESMRIAISFRFNPDPWMLIDPK
jgi:hypothetical protein